MLTPGEPDLLDGSQERSVRLTVDARKIKIRGEGAWTLRWGSRTHTSVGAQVRSMTRRRRAEWCGRGPWQKLCQLLG